MSDARHTAYHPNPSKESISVSWQPIIGWSQEIETRTFDGWTPFDAAPHLGCQAIARTEAADQKHVGEEAHEILTSLLDAVRDERLLVVYFCDHGGREVAARASSEWLLDGYLAEVSARYETLETSAGLGVLTEIRAEGTVISRLRGIVVAVDRHHRSVTVESNAWRYATELAHELEELKGAASAMESCLQGVGYPDGNVPDKAREVRTQHRKSAAALRQLRPAVRRLEHATLGVRNALGSSLSAHEGTVWSRIDRELNGLGRRGRECLESWESEEAMLGVTATTLTATQARVLAITALCVTALVGTVTATSGVLNIINWIAEHR